jgi:hypothetical protein
MGWQRTETYNLGIRRNCACSPLWGQLFGEGTLSTRVEGERNLQFSNSRPSLLMSKQHILSSDLPPQAMVSLFLF